jgi:CheY-specific phosphatase CheX
MSHAIADATVTDAVGSVLGSLVGLPVAACPGADRSVSNAVDVLTGIVTITGDADAVVVLRCERVLAADIAAAMFAMSTGELGDSDIVDALGEVTNVSGGAIKALLDGTCRLGLPIVTVGRDLQIDVPGGRTAARASFHHDGRALSVELLLADQDAAIDRWVDRITGK